MTPSSSHRLFFCASPGGLRAGFTLTELLVVITIIGILSSLMLAGLAVARDGVRAGKTGVTIRKINEVLLPYYEDYEVRRPALPTVPNPSRNLNAELRRIALRRLMALELPESQADLTDMIEGLKNSQKQDGKYAAVANYGRFTIGPDSPAKGLVLTEVPPTCRRYAEIIYRAGEPGVSSAELLYMIVMRGPMAESDVLAQFRSDEIGDTDGDGLPEFLDAWRRPIRFRRWPVGLDSPVQSTSSLPDLNFSKSGYPLVPLIYSAGKNGEYDLEAANHLAPPPDAGYKASNYDPFVATGAAAISLSAAAADDITNHDLVR